MGAWRDACRVQACDVTDRALSTAVEKFVSDISTVLRDMAGSLPAPLAAHFEDDVTVEAFNLAVALCDADGRHTDTEVWALLAAFGPRFATQLGAATPGDVRKAGLLEGKRAWLTQASVLFELMVSADQSHRTANSWTYYDRAMHLAYTVCSLDDHPSDAELRSLEAWRSMLVRAMSRAGVARAVAAKPGSDRPRLPGRGLAGPLAPTPTDPTAPNSASGAQKETPAPVQAPAPVDEPPVPLEELLAELDGLVGLAGVKAEVKLVTNLLRVQQLRKERGLPVVDSSRHLVFTGNPGTGKTTVARLLAKIYHTLGVAERGHLIETDRAGLVAGFVGQTALKVTEVFDAAMGGILLIDEAYALARGGERDFGREAIDTLVKLIEDRRDAVVVIAAGYPAEMAEFIDTNPGLRSRFPKTIAFADYSDVELAAIFASLCKKNQYTPTDDAKAKLLAYFAGQERSKGFGNGRLARNLFEQTIANQATRLMEGRPSSTSPSAASPSPTSPSTTSPSVPDSPSDTSDAPIASSAARPTDEELATIEAADIPGYDITPPTDPIS